MCEFTECVKPRKVKVRDGLSWSLSKDSHLRGRHHCAQCWEIPLLRNQSAGRGKLSFGVSGDLMKSLSACLRESTHR